MNREEGLYQQSADADPFCQMEIYICIRKDWCIMGTVIVGIIVLAIAGGAAYSLHRDKKNGKSQCGGDCSRCGGHCH